MNQASMNPAPAATAATAGIRRTVFGSSVVGRRSLLGAAAALSGAALTGCIGSGGGSPKPVASGAKNANAPLTLQIAFSEPKVRDALLTVVKEFPGPKTTVNAVASEQFRAQLSTYLTSATPPDVIGWLAGSVARDYAKQGLLLDVSDMWTGDGVCANFSPALKALSSTEDGKQIFIPTSYYWWSIFYRKSAFKGWGVEPPTTWDDFIKLCNTLKKKGINPLTNGIGSTPWMASGWFDYLNLRINGAPYHRELLAGEHSFTDPQVVKVMQEYKRILPYFDPNMTSYDNQTAVTPLVQKKAAMFLTGSFISTAVPKSVVDDLDFFSVPTIDPSIASAEEAPTDGYMASAKAPNPTGAKELMAYLAKPDPQQKYIELSASATIPTSPDVDTSNFSPMVKKGLALLDKTKEITQFFNRDSSDELQLTADKALTRFIDHPDELTSILKDWQKSAEKVWKS
ncbi:ABC transporter substrate-binding protein [Microlunatus soli]|uniref:Carbohydrate ABC transporter substrate-binding protein, CUT1 family n=1 Tax=Microlunatus soli TaxID=630515 RepID=A0A1H1TEB7_9ACTN|nr:extracellular solute-binding protein [Microlunatus soli]SDS58518.1 carbohydrate ABC transporter substrate-binding protein, CUT1 family [Microlunatus soli]